MKLKTLKTLVIILLVISMFELFISGLLTAAKYSDSIAVLCGEDSSNSCNTVQSSEFSNIVNLKDNNNNITFQVPITLIGVFYYIFIIFYLFRYLKFLNLKNSKSLLKKMNKNLLILASLGFLFSISYTLIQAFIIEAYCKYCLTSAFLTSLLFFIIFYIFIKEK